jgi:RNA polymerase sigma-70 factor (ECF subfamily)
MQGFFSFLQGSRANRQQLEQHRQRLYRVAYAWTHDAALADDLAQETLMKAMRRSDQLRDASAGRAWLYSILTNCYRDHFRRLRETDDVDDLEIPHDSTPETEIDQSQVVERVRHAIARLPEGQRQVVTLVDLEGFSYVEVSQILDVPIGTVMSRLCRARAALKTLLAYLKEGHQSADMKGQNQHPGTGMHIRRIK